MEITRCRGNLRYMDSPLRKLPELAKTYLTRGRQAKCKEIMNRYDEPKLVRIAPVFRREASSYDIHVKLHRYEVQHENSMYRALRELERLQARRCGRPVLAPVAVDVALSGSEVKNN